MVTERVDRETVFLPFHFAGKWQGEDISVYYPEGAKPVVSGEAVNTATTYGYDPVTHSWQGESAPAEFGTFSREWRKLGAALIGGCCRTTPAHIRQISDRFRRNAWPTE